MFSVLMIAVQRDDDGQADRRFSGSHDDDEEYKYLAVEIPQESAKRP